MSMTRFVCAAGALAAFASSSAQGNLLTNGNLDVTYQQEIVPGFFLPKPDGWVNDGSRAVTGPYEDEMSSEPWSGPAPTPVTANGVDPDGPGGNPGDWGVFFKPFSGNSSTGDFATGHLYQDVPGTPGTMYTMTGWAGAEANFFGNAYFALEFLDGGGAVIGGSTLDLLAAGLLTDNGEAFDYKQYMVSAMSPAGTVSVRARATMADASANPAGGGQAYVVDDFTLVPEPTAALAMMLLGTVAFARRR